MKFSIHVMSLKVTWFSIFKSCSFNHSKMADVQTFEVDVKLSPVSTVPWNVVFWVSRDEQLLIRPFVWNKKNTNFVCVWKLKFVFFMHGTNKPLHADKIWYGERSWADLQVVFESLFYLTKLLVCDDAKFWGSIGTNTKPCMYNTMPWPFVAYCA
jgi:hypothetical protein